MIQLECRASTGTGLSTVYRDNTPEPISKFEIDLSVEQQLTAVQQTYSNALSSSPFVTLGGSLLPKSCRREPAQVSVMTLSITVTAGFAATVPRPTKVPTIRTLAR